MTTEIRNPVNYVSVQRQGYCTQCERDFVTVYEHSQYPGMKVDESCLDLFGAHSFHVLDLKRDLDVWEAIAKKQGRNIVPRI